jgi:hypothetical protein
VADTAGVAILAELEQVRLDSDDPRNSEYRTRERANQLSKIAVAGNSQSEMGTSMGSQAMVRSQKESGSDDTPSSFPLFL